MTEQRGSKCELVLLLVKAILGPAAWFQESLAVAFKKKSNLLHPSGLSVN